MNALDVRRRVLDMLDRWDEEHEPSGCPARVGECIHSAAAAVRVGLWRERGARSRLLRRRPGGAWEEIAGPIVGAPHLAADVDEHTPVDRWWRLAGFWLRAGRHFRRIWAGRGTAGRRLRRWR